MDQLPFTISEGNVGLTTSLIHCKILLPQNVDLTKPGESFYEFAKQQRLNATELVTFEEQPATDDTTSTDASGESYTMSKKIIDNLQIKLKKFFPNNNVF